MFVFTKQPAEVIAGLGIDFTTRFPAGTLITGAVSASAGITVGVAVVAGMVVHTIVSGGTAGEDYLVTYTATGNEGSKRYGIIQIRVRDH